MNANIIDRITRYSLIFFLFFCAKNPTKTAMGVVLSLVFVGMRDWVSEIEFQDPVFVAVAKMPSILCVGLGMFLVYLPLLFRKDKTEEAIVQHLNGVDEILRRAEGGNEPDIFLRRQVYSTILEKYIEIGPDKDIDFEKMSNIAEGIGNKK